MVCLVGLHFPIIVLPWQSLWNYILHSPSEDWNISLQSLQISAGTKRPSLPGPPSPGTLIGAPMHMGLGASRPGLSQGPFSEVQLFPVLLLAVPSLPSELSRLASGLTCSLSFCFGLFFWVVLLVHQWEFTLRLLTLVDQPPNPYQSNTKAAIPPVHIVLSPISSSMLPFFIFRSSFTFKCKKKSFRERKENIQYFWSLLFVKTWFSSSLYIKYW